MNEPDLSKAHWFKSSYSNAQANCVEIARVSGRVATRDSKDPDGPALLFTAGEWTSFLTGLTNGEFDQP